MKLCDIFIGVAVLLLAGLFFVAVRSCDSPVDKTDEQLEKEARLKSDTVNILRGRIEAKDAYSKSLEAILDSLQADNAKLTKRLAAAGRAIFVQKIPKFKTGGEARNYLDSLVALEGGL